MGDLGAHRKAFIGNLDSDFWVYDSDRGFDLTHSSSPTTERIPNAVTIQTTTSAITINPRKSALVIIDMQNFFLSPALGRPEKGKAVDAQEQLLQHAIPAAREAGIQIAWLNWGLSDEDLKVMPPSVHRSFGFLSISASEFEEVYSNPSSSTHIAMGKGHLNEADTRKNPRLYKGLGQSLGDITLADGTVVSAGRMLMRHQWNTELSSSLDASFRESLQTGKADVRLNKSRMSGLHVPGSPAGLYFQNHGVKTLFFAGVNTDQCVNGTLMDAFCQGYDCILLRDGCATSSAGEAQQCVEANVAGTMGWVVSCQAFAQGIHQSRTNGVSVREV